MLSLDGKVSSVSMLRADPPGQPVFIMPDAAPKTFDGGVRSRLEFDADLQMVIASPGPIDVECRVFMVAPKWIPPPNIGEMASRRWGFVPNEGVDLAIKADSSGRPTEAYAIDMARSGERFGHVGANCITAARQYAADGQAIVEPCVGSMVPPNRDRSSIWSGCRRG
jgi:hypothetical protein